MRVTIKNMSEVIDDKLTLTERGLLITIILLKDNDPKLTLAKVRAKFRIQDVKVELVKLHKLGLIEWSGYKDAVKSLEEKELDPKVVEVVEFMNNLYKRKFDPNSKSTTVNLINRLLEHSLDEVKLVVSNRYAVWKDDPTMEVHLNPTTIFRPSKFDKYLEEANRTKEGERFLSASKISLKEGDELTSEIAKTLLPTEVYTFMTYKLNSEGERVGNGVESSRYGKDIARAISIRNNNMLHGASKDWEYTYKEK
jgi:uncharacterized phage protein (TIGR02220 family)